MSGSPYQYINSTGVIVPDTTDLQTTVQTEFGVALPTIAVDPTSPQGVLITAEVTARSNVLKNNALLANQINPNESAGQFLDAIAALTDLARTLQSFSTYTNVALVGDPDLNVPEGTQAKTTNGDIFQTLSAVTLDPATGLGTVNMAAIVAGPIPAPDAPLTLYSAVLGLTSFTPASAGTLGVVQQSDVSFRALRRNTLAKQGISLSEAITSALYALPNVLGLQYLENTGAATTIETIVMEANSIWACVDGGSATAIANALLGAKSGGAGWNGAQSVAAVDPYSGQTYDVKYDVPTLVPMLVRLTVKAGTYSGPLISAVQNAMLAFASNTVAENTPTDLGIIGFTLGNNVSPFEIASGITAQVPGVYVQKVEIATVASPTYQTTEIEIAINQKPTVTLANVDVVVGS